LVRAANTTSHYGRKIWGWVVKIAVKVKGWVVRLAVKVKDWFVKVGKPLYKFICDVCITLSDFLKLFVTKMIEAIKLLLTSIRRVFTFVFNVVRGLGRGYLQLLASIMHFFLKFGRLGDLVFTPIALAYLGLPLVLCYFFYWKPVAIVPASILTAVLCLRGYKVLQTAQP